MATIIFKRGVLDRMLAAGADPGESPTLARRARKLTSPRFRAGLAACINNLLEAAEEPRPGFGSAVPIERAEILCERELLLELAADLRSDDRVSARGVALVEQLLTDGASPVYTPSPTGTLHASLTHARAALYLA